MHFTECPLYSPLTSGSGLPPRTSAEVTERAEVVNQKPADLLALKPAIYGVGIDLKEAGRRLRKRFQRRRAVVRAFRSNRGISACPRARRRGRRASGMRLLNSSRPTSTTRTRAGPMLAPPMNSWPGARPPVLPSIGAVQPVHVATDRGRDARARCAERQATACRDPALAMIPGAASPPSACMARSKRCNHGLDPSHLVCGGGSRRHGPEHLMLRT